ncbi:tRNA dimethylallyltransferase 2 [Acorus calamus]|uniref:tRNA dimethylallyltransferase 2 n=1 Tax=Acorus calamus TaxID=4465 RepID=A0AAV9E8L6_ACOCL|nr:tRNA dimethylallyltransferase 2 [Acorus calamus]
MEPPEGNPNPRNQGGGGAAKGKPKVVVVMGPTGAGKSRLSIDLALHFEAAEIVSADSMQVYRRLDVLTNKVPLHDRRGVPHHLLGSVDPNVEFTAKDFRDLAIPIIEGILSRNRLPIIVGGTNYYIQALVSPFLLDDFMETTDDFCSADPIDDLVPIHNSEEGICGSSSLFDSLKDLDPAAANRIHPNDHRKINQYLRLYARSGVLPSELFQGKASENWGRADDFRYDCCYIWVDASTPVLDRYVEQRVDWMMDAGLLNEVYDIYRPGADYTRGLRQAIGVREFEEFFREFHIKQGDDSMLANKGDFIFKYPESNLETISESMDGKHQNILSEAIDNLKANTRRLVRKQRRRLNRLKTFFGWDLHYVDATEAFQLGNSEETWQTKVVYPCIDLVKGFLCKETSFDSLSPNGGESKSMASRNLWTQYVCEACGDRVLRGAHEWEQHKQGRGHRKCLARLRKNSQISQIMDTSHST